MFTTLFRYHFFTTLFRYYFLWRPVGRWVEISAAPFISLWSPIQPQTLPPPRHQNCNNIFVREFLCSWLLFEYQWLQPLLFTICLHPFSWRCVIFACLLFFIFPIIGWIVFSAKKSGNQCQMSQKKGTLRIKFLFFWPQTFFLTFHIYIDLQTNWWNPNGKFFTVEVISIGILEKWTEWDI